MLVADISAPVHLRRLARPTSSRWGATTGCGLLLQAERIAGAVLAVPRSCCWSAAGSGRALPSGGCSRRCCGPAGPRSCALALSVANDIAAQPSGRSPSGCVRRGERDPAVRVRGGAAAQRLARARRRWRGSSWRSAAKPRRGLRDALADALGDPALELAYWLPAASGTWTATAARWSCRAWPRTRGHDRGGPRRAGGRDRATTPALRASAS